MSFQRISNIHLFILITAVLSTPAIYAHNGFSNGKQPLNWSTPQISQVVAILPFQRPANPRTDTFEGKHCAIGNLLSFNVSDDYAYDIDEAVTVEFEFDMRTTPTKIVLRYDKNGDFSGTEELQIKKHDGQRFYRHAVTLKRARFAGRSLSPYDVSPPVNGDFSIGTPTSNKDIYEEITVCDIKIHRSYQSPKVSEYGRLSLELMDESGQMAPARIGIYNNTGRMPLPQKEAIPVRYGINDDSDIARSVTVGHTSWPANNSHAFYVNGSYHAKLPVGIYHLVVVRGLEYKFVQKSFEIVANQETPIVIKLERWTDMPAKGWYSGDVHIHLGRNGQEDDKNTRIQMQAEDLNVANLLQMGTIASTYYRQNKWGESGRYGEYPYTLVSGQEDPRSRLLGHVIQLNIDKEIRNNPDRYYLYHEAFNKARSQGGLAGYAHGGSGTCPGFALDLPYKIIDFVEVTHGITEMSKCWFDALNLGYKLSPAAGTDYPIGNDKGPNTPGAVRNYVNTEKPFSVQAWFDGLKAGHTFVTNGPMLELTIIGYEIGSDINVNKGEQLVVKARARINPDIGFLESIELVQQGEVVAVESSKNGSEELNLNYQFQVDSGGWFVLRAKGKNEKIHALSAPIYVRTASSGFCNPSVIPSIVEKYKRSMQKILEVKEIKFESQGWASLWLTKKLFPANKTLLQQRINETIKMYDHIVDLSNDQRCVSG